MDASRKDRSTERPPSPEAPRSTRRRHRGRLALGATAVGLLATATALAPAAADVMRADTSTRSDATIAARVDADRDLAPSREDLIRAEALEERYTRAAEHRRNVEIWTWVATENAIKVDLWKRTEAWVWAEQQKAAAQAEAERVAAQAAEAQAADAAPGPESAPAPSGGGGGGGPWDALAQCESGGSWSTNTGNGYYGGLQFSLQTWQGFGGSGMPHENSREAQIAVAQRVLASQGWGAWPSCSRQLGLG